jgi:hypothetical protein
MSEDNPQPKKRKPGASWFKSFRSEDAIELIRSNKNALVLAFVIAIRARWKTTGFHRFDLQPGEALLGDYQSYGMTEREYRTAKENLSEWKFATFRTTNRGTIGKLTDTRLFSVLQNQNDGQNAKQTTDERRTDDEQTTTNLEGHRRPYIKKKEGLPEPSGSGHSAQLGQKSKPGSDTKDGGCVGRL